MPVSGYASWSVIAGEQPTTSKWNILGTNDAAFNTFLTNSPVAFSGTTMTLNGNPAWQYLGCTLVTGLGVTTTSTTPAQQTAFNTTVTIPTGVTKVRVTVYVPFMYGTAAGCVQVLTLWSGTFGSGNPLQYAQNLAAAANNGSPVTLVGLHTPSAGNITYSVGLHVNGNTGGLQDNSYTSTPAFLLVECC